MERKGKWTRGPAVAEFDGVRGGDGEEVAITEEAVWREWDEREANASIIASAFNAATACEDMGYDGEACVKALPELVEAVNEFFKQQDAPTSTDGFEINRGRADAWVNLRNVYAKCRC